MNTQKMFKDLKVNDAFMIDNVFYMVTHRIKINGVLSNAIRISTNARAYFEPDTIVWVQ